MNFSITYIFDNLQDFISFLRFLIRKRIGKPTVFYKYAEVRNNFRRFVLILAGYKSLYIDGECNGNWEIRVKIIY